MTPAVAQAWQQQWLRDLLDVRLRVSPTIRARVLRLNPVVREGELIRGLHRAETVAKAGFYRMVVTRAAFDARWGRGASRRVPRHDRQHAGGRRFWIDARAFEDGPRPLTH